MKPFPPQNLLSKLRIGMSKLFRMIENICYYIVASIPLHPYHKITYTCMFRDDIVYLCGSRDVVILLLCILLARAYCNVLKSKRASK